MVDNEFNKKQYQNNLQTFINIKQVNDIGGGTVSDRIALLSSHIPKASCIFEIGSGAGEDALALQEAGYRVVASDFVLGFVEKCKEKGLPAQEFDAKHDEIPHDTEVVYANAVFVHFTPTETQDFLTKARAHLVGPKVIFLSVLKGDGAERSARAVGFERDFQYYSPEQLSQLVSSAGYTIEVSRVIKDKWIQIVARVKS